MPLSMPPPAPRRRSSPRVVKGSNSSASVEYNEEADEPDELADEDLDDDHIHGQMMTTMVQTRTTWARAYGRSSQSSSSGAVERVWSTISNGSATLPTTTRGNR